MKPTATEKKIYNHATTSLAIYSNGTFQDKLSEAVYYCHPGAAMTNYMKTCSFLHANFTESIKVVENLYL